MPDTTMRPDTFVSPDGPTLQDVLDRLPSHPRLTPATQRELFSAVRKVARWLQRTPAELPANWSFLVRRLDQIHPKQVGVSTGRIANVRYLVKRALRELGIAVSMASHLAKMSPAWGALLDSVDAYQRRSLMRFGRFCSAAGIEPPAVTQEIAESFYLALVSEGIAKDPFVLWQNASRAWNRARSNVPSWPSAALTVPRKAVGYTLPRDSFPKSFQEDVEEHLRRLSLDDPLGDHGPRRPLKPLSIKTRRNQLFQLASALVRQGHSQQAISGIAYLVDPDNAASALRFFLQRHQDKRHVGTPFNNSMIAGLAHALRMVAKHHVRVPDAQLERLEQLTARLGERRSGLAETNRRRLAQFDDPAAIGRLLLLPETEAERLLKINRPSRADALKMSLVVAVAILLRAPMRIHNLASLDIERDLKWTKPGRRGEVFIRIMPHRVKNRQLLEYRLSGGAAELARIYLDRFRPLLTKPNNSCLFPGHDEKPKRADTLSKQLLRFIWSHAGLQMNAHLFRHFAAKIMLQDQPGNYEGVRRILGHADSETTYNFYEGFETGNASAEYDRILQKRRDAMVPASPAKRPRPRRGRRH